MVSSHKIVEFNVSENGRYISSRLHRQPRFEIGIGRFRFGKCELNTRRCYDGFKWMVLGCKRHVAVVSVLHAVDGGQLDPNLEKQTGVPTQKESNVLL